MKKKKTTIIEGKAIEIKEMRGQVLK